MSFADLYRLATRDGDPDPPPRDVARGPSPDHPYGRRVLITEDNWLIANDWEGGLSDAGYVVTGIAVSAEEALEMCIQDPPDFAIVDIRLLGPRDGVDLAIELRTRCNLGSIFVSAHDDPETRQRAAPAQPLGWIAKPIVASRIGELIRNLARPRS